MKMHGKHSMKALNRVSKKRVIFINYDTGFYVTNPAQN
jgi:hypothetical protein